MRSFPELTEASFFSELPLIVTIIFPIDEMSLVGGRFIGPTGGMSSWPGLFLCETELPSSWAEQSSSDPDAWDSFSDKKVELWRKKFRLFQGLDMNTDLLACHVLVDIDVANAAAATVWTFVGFWTYDFVKILVRILYKRVSFLGPQPKSFIIAIGFAKSRSWIKHKI
jgi:hypothetical protein